MEIFATNVKRILDCQMTLKNAFQVTNGLTFLFVKKIPIKSGTKETIMAVVLGSTLAVKTTMKMDIASHARTINMLFKDFATKLFQTIRIIDF
jgi:hypothetical protein